LDQVSRQPEGWPKDSHPTDSDPKVHHLCHDVIDPKGLNGYRGFGRKSQAYEKKGVTRRGGENGSRFATILHKSNGLSRKFDSRQKPVIK
jgi:hypothetical protein